MNKPIREVLNENQAISITIVGVLMVAAFSFVAMRMLGLFSSGGGEKEPMAYFYDQNTKKLFTQPATVQGPVETDSGPYQNEPAGVRAHVYACGQCADESARFIGWLSKPLPPDQRPPANDPSSEVTLIRRETDDGWVRSDSAEGAKIVTEATSGCNGDTRLNYCRPDPE